MTGMLSGLGLDTLQQRRRQARLVFLFKIIRGVVPAIRRDEFLSPVLNKRKIHARKFEDSVCTNPVKRHSFNHAECYKVKPANSDQYRQSFFIKAVQDWNSLEGSVACAKTVESFRAALTHHY